MKPLPHRYDVHLDGGPDKYARLSATGLPSMWSAAPPEFDGPGDAWTPEHLFVAAVETCFLFTFRAVARAAKLEFVTLEAEASGTVDRYEKAIRFIEIVVRPKLTVRHGVSCDLALQVLEKSEKACLVSASVSTPIRFEPEVRELPEVVASMSRSA